MKRTIYILLHLRRLVVSPLISICSSDDTSLLLHSRTFSLVQLGINRSKGTSSVSSVFNFIRRLASYFSSCLFLSFFLPSFIDVLYWWSPNQGMDSIGEEAYLERSVPQLTPIRDARREETEASVCRRWQDLTRGWCALRDYRHPMILECRSTNSGLIRECPPIDW